MVHRPEAAAMVDLVAAMAEVVSIMRVNTLVELLAIDRKRLTFPYPDL